ncbi:MAG: hypothetical protein IT287_04065 [Bdellovibrionaceae bacterium]|nr:hypothetical protein [Pseudobdellovibrionaceae bacterium]
MSLLIEKLSLELRTPEDVQRHILSMPYNCELNGETIRSAEQTLKHHTGHCLETAFAAAALLEYNGHPPYILSMESQDLLDHVVFIFKLNGLWGSIGRSREAGLQGRKPVYRTVRDLMWSYYDPYIDDSGRLIGYQVFHLDETQADWRFSENNLWRVQSFLCEEKHIRLNSSDSRYKKLMDRYMKKGPLEESPVWWY